MHKSYFAYLVSRCLRAKSILDFDRTCVGVHQKRANIKCAIVLATTMTCSSTAVIMASKAYCIPEVCS